MTDSAAAPPDTSSQIVRLIGVYDADSTVRGEVAYWIGARLGRRHCSLCDITHSSVRQRPEWKACRAGLPVPFDTYHRNDQPTDVRVATAAVAPIVVAETPSGLTVLLGPTELDACAGSIDRLENAIETAVITRGLTWPGAPTRA